MIIISDDLTGAADCGVKFVEEGLSTEIILNSEPVFTPTFILLENNLEKYRFEGYLGEEFFWSFLEEYLEKITSAKKK